MTEENFFRLEVDTVISNRFTKDVYFVIYDTDQMGTAYKGKRCRVYGTKQIDHDTNIARIDIGNCQFWNIEGKMRI